MYSWEMATFVLFFAFVFVSLCLVQNECRWWTLPFDIIVGGGSHKGCSVTPHPSLQGPPGGNLPTIPLSFFPSLFKFFDEQGLGCMARKDWRNPFVSYWCPNLLASLNNIPTPNSFCPIFWISESESFEISANAPKQQYWFWTYDRKMKKEERMTRLTRDKVAMKGFYRQGPV